LKKNTEKIENKAEKWKRNGQNMNNEALCGKNKIKKLQIKKRLKILRNGKKEKKIKKNKRKLQKTANALQGETNENVEKVKECIKQIKNNEKN